MYPALEAAKAGIYLDKNVSKGHFQYHFKWTAWKFPSLFDP